MKIIDYTTAGGKNLIMAYIDDLTNKEQFEAFRNGETIYFLHACKKQKNKAEKNELETAIKRAKEFGFEVD